MGYKYYHFLERNLSALLELLRKATSMIGIISDFLGSIVSLIQGVINGLVDAIAGSLTGGGATEAEGGTESFS